MTEWAWPVIKLPQAPSIWSQIFPCGLLHGKNPPCTSPELSGTSTASIKGRLGCWTLEWFEHFRVFFLGVFDAYLFPFVQNVWGPILVVLILGSFISHRNLYKSALGPWGLIWLLKKVEEILWMFQVFIALKNWGILGRIRPQSRPSKETLRTESPSFYGSFYGTLAVGWLLFSGVR